MADNPTDATSSAPGSSSTSTKVTGEPPATSDSKTASPGITPSTPQPAASGSGASQPTLVPASTNNPKPVGKEEQKASTTNDVENKAASQPAVSATDKDKPKSDEDWDKPDEVDAMDVYEVMRQALNQWAEEDLEIDEDDENPHFSRHRNVVRALDSGALKEADSRLHDIAEMIASHLNGGR